MKFFITGGTGFVGSSLTRELLARDHQVTVTSSTSSHMLQHPSLQYIRADTTDKGDWQNTIGAYDVIINLAGRSIFHLWTESYKNEMYASRVKTTKNIVAALTENTDTVLLSASAAGYYGDGGDSEKDETSAAGHDFLAKVCDDWENAALTAKDKGARVAVMRFGVVLGRDGGAIATMKTPFNLGLGGPIGQGRQWFPWIHIQDLIEAVIFLTEGSDLHGAFNFTAPGVVRQKDFAKTFGKVMKRPAFIPAPAFIMKTVLGEFGKSLLMGQKVVPNALLERGFLFRYPTLTEALQEIVNG